jgi:hypothetical protein
MINGMSRLDQFEAVRRMAQERLQTSGNKSAESAPAKNASQVQSGAQSALNPMEKLLQTIEAKKSELSSQGSGSTGKVSTPRMTVEQMEAMYNIQSAKTAPSSRVLQNYSGQMNVQQNENTPKRTLGNFLDLTA